jgi:hypothetical protein
VPASAFAQPSPPTSSGPMTVERMHNGWYGAGDVKLTEVDHRASTLIGGQGGRIFDDAFFVGGAGYWLANGSHDHEMAYGGIVIQYMLQADRRVAFGGKMLIGGGQATLADNIRVASRTGPRVTTVRYYEGFFLVEPEATASVRVVDHVRLTGGVGYRAVNTYDHVDNRLGGVTGSIGFSIS